MPLYDFKCKACDYIFEESHKIVDRLVPTQAPCPKCGGPLELCFGTPGFVDPMRIGVTKRPEWFKDRLREIKKKHPLGKIDI